MSLCRGQQLMPRLTLVTVQRISMSRVLNHKWNIYVIDPSPWCWSPWARRSRKTVRAKGWGRRGWKCVLDVTGPWPAPDPASWRFSTGGGSTGTLPLAKHLLTVDGFEGREIQFSLGMWSLASWPWPSGRPYTHEYTGNIGLCGL